MVIQNKHTPNDIFSIITKNDKNFNSLLPKTQ